MLALIILEVCRVITCGIFSCFKKKKLNTVDSKSSIAERMESDDSKHHITSNVMKAEDHDY